MPAPEEGTVQDAAQPLETTLVRPSPWAAPAAVAPPPAFAAGTVIQKTFSTWWKNLLPFLAVTAAAYGPFIAVYLGIMRTAFGAAMQPDVLGAAADAGGPTAGAALGADPAVIGAAAVVGGAVVSLLFSVMYGGLSVGTFQHLRGERPAVGALLRAGVRRALPVFVLMLVAWIAIALGMFMLLVPGVMLACVWAASLPACVVERLGPFASLGRSAALTRGHRMQIFLVFLALLGVTWAASAAVQVVAMVVMVAVPSQHGPLALALVSHVGGMPFAMLLPIGAAATYHELRAAREGLDSGHLAVVFE